MRGHEESSPHKGYQECALPRAGGNVGMTKAGAEGGVEARRRRTGSVALTESATQQEVDSPITALSSCSMSEEASGSAEHYCTRGTHEKFRLRSTWYSQSVNVSLLECRIADAFDKF